MTDAQKQALRDDFLEWSGGFPPDDGQIEEYMDSSMSSSFGDEQEARAFLKEWAQEEWTGRTSIE